jgi:hypothetical protein
MPQDPLGPLPEEFRNDPLLVDIDSMKFSRSQLVCTDEQYSFLYGLYGKISLTDALAKPSLTPHQGQDSTQGDLGPNAHLVSEACMEP